MMLQAELECARTMSSQALAQAVGAICRQLSHLTNAAGLYRMAYLLHEVAQEADLVDEIDAVLPGAN